MLHLTHTKTLRIGGAIFDARQWYVIVHFKIIESQAKIRSTVFQFHSVFIFNVRILDVFYTHCIRYECTQTDTISHNIRRERQRQRTKERERETKLTPFVEIKTHRRHTTFELTKNDPLPFSSDIRVFTSCFFAAEVAVVVVVRFNGNALCIHLTVFIHCQRKLLIANPTRQNCIRRDFFFVPPILISYRTDTTKKRRKTAFLLIVYEFNAYRTKQKIYYVKRDRL